jgi:hypothetical protein
MLAFHQLTANLLRHGKKLPAAQVRTNQLDSHSVRSGFIIGRAAGERESVLSGTWLAAAGYFLLRPFTFVIRIFDTIKLRRGRIDGTVEIPRMLHIFTRCYVLSRFYLKNA